MEKNHTLKANEVAEYLRKYAMLCEARSDAADDLAQRRFMTGQIKSSRYDTYFSELWLTASQNAEQLARLIDMEVECGQKEPI